MAKSTLSAEEAKRLVGHYCKVNGAASFFYGQIIAVHPSGDYLHFQRGSAAKFRPKWYHRSDVFPHEPQPSAGQPASTA